MNILWILLKNNIWFAIIRKSNSTGDIMNDRIKIFNGKEEGYTAKEAMAHVVEYMKVGTVHPIEMVSIEDTKEAGEESPLFVKMFMRYLHRNSKKVFLLARDEDMLHKLKTHIEKSYSRIHIMGAVEWDGQESACDMILNQVNGAEVDCVVAAIKTDVQDVFWEKYRASLDAKVWIGLGTTMKRKKKSSVFVKVRKIFLKFSTREE